MPTIMLGTSDALLNLNFTRAAAAADAKLAAIAPVTHPPAPNYTATLGLAYMPDAVLNRNWDTLDLAIATGSVPALRTLRFTSEAASNINFGRILVTLAAAGIIIPTEAWES
jgi:hypothetical protein